jgi:hypothetical protein
MDRAHQAASAAAGHVHVGEHGVRDAAIHDQHSVDAIGRGRDLEAVLLEQLAQHRRGHGVVVDDDHEAMPPAVG